jgi:glycine betaine/proline transport system substrate-binding protein
MTRTYLCSALAACIISLGAWPAAADDACKTVRFADVGWTDITATTAIATELLHDGGYRTRIDLLSVPVTFMSLHNGDIDVFLGNWMPTQTADIAPYLEKGTVVDVGVNLDGALYTLAVPRYVHEAGVTSAEHLAAHRASFKRRLHGIEPGNDGNRTVLDMIAQNTYGLSGWQLVESSEQGMLAEVRRAVAKKEWIVFLGWKPHPMNTAVDMEYLADPLEVWGPGGGASTVHTVVSKRFAERCPELIPFFRGLSFTVDMENLLMGYILDDTMEPAAAARRWMSAHPDQVAALKSALAPPRGQAAARAADAPPADAAAPVSRDSRKLPLGAWIARFIELVTEHLGGPLRAMSSALTWVIDTMVGLFSRVPPLVLIALLAALSFALQRRIALPAMVLAGSLLIWNLGYWQPTIETLALVLTATVMSLSVGVPVGIWAARRPRVYAGLRFILDLMQTIPTFVYLIPTLMLFGLGVVPGIISTAVFALPASIRLTHLGITSVPREVIEAGDAFGARPMQRLLAIELPYAMPAIMEGVTQTLMLSLSMVVIAALVGAGGLGAPVIRALNTVNVAQGFEAGLSIVILAILLDRAFRYRTRSTGADTSR